MIGDPRHCCLAVALVALTCSHLQAEDWPLFRGPNAGVSDGQNLPVTWGTKTNVTWSIEVPGRGWSSPIISGDRIFVTSVVRDGGFEDAKKGLYFGGERPKVPDAVHRWMVSAYDLKAGTLLWEREAAKG